MHRNIIKICMGSSCFTRGNMENLQIIKDFLKDNNIDSEISLIGNLCEGRCKSGPNIFLNDKLYQDVTTDKIDLFLNEIPRGDINV